MLNLCHQPGCLHPLCGKDVTDSTWYDNGPPLMYVPVPIPGVATVMIARDFVQDISLDQKSTKTMLKNLVSVAACSSRQVLLSRKRFIT